MIAYGTLRITNSDTLNKWKLSGKYQNLISEGYIYAEGCGRFRLDICECHKCRYYKRKQQDNDTNPK
jgi:hypothetical protein